MDQDNPAVAKLLEIPPAVLEAAATDPAFVPSMGKRYLLVAMSRLNQALRAHDVSIPQRIAAVDVFAKISGVNRQNDQPLPSAVSVTFNFNGKRTQASLSTEDSSESVVDVQSREVVTMPSQIQASPVSEAQAELNG